MILFSMQVSVRNYYGYYKFSIFYTQLTSSIALQSILKSELTFDIDNPPELACISSITH